MQTFAISCMNLKLISGKCKMNLSLYLIKHHDVKTVRELEIQHNAFLSFTGEDCTDTIR
jgi:hypothetical protein